MRVLPTGLPHDNLSSRTVKICRRYRRMRSSSAAPAKNRTWLPTCWFVYFSEAVEDPEKDSSDAHCEITQWSRGVHIALTDQLTINVRLLSKPCRHVTIICCGPANQRKRLFFVQVRLMVSWFVCDVFHSINQSFVYYPVDKPQPVNTVHTRLKYKVLKSNQSSNRLKIKASSVLPWLNSQLY